MALPLATGRSFLFVPASRPERIGRALDSAADCVIVDLEDAVAPDDKELARLQAAAALQALDAPRRQRTLVRINAADSAWHADDLRALAPLAGAGLGGVVVPKAESVAALQGVAAALGAQLALVPLVETLAGLDAIDLLAGAPQVVRLAFGHLDFQLDLGMRCTPDEPELAGVRLQFVAASRRKGLAAPVDGVTVALGDAERLQRDARRARAMGFGGKLCIHPAQAGGVNLAFTPDAAEIAWATQVVAAAAASGGSVVRVDGKMVDAPVIRLAERTLLAAQRAAA